MPWLAVLLHFLIGERADHGTGQDALDEYVFLQDDLLSGRAADGLEQRLGSLRIVLYRHRRHERLHAHHRAYPIRVAMRPVQP